MARRGETMGRLIADKYKERELECEERFNQLKANEEELNRIFIEIYGLQNELEPVAILLGNSDIGLRIRKG